MAIIQKYYRLILVLSIIGLFIFHFQEVLSGAVFYGPFKDNIFWNLPQMSSVSRLLISGELPLYDPVGFFPLYQNPIFSFLYPLNFLWLDLYQTLDEAMMAVYVLVLLHYGLILIATYFLLRTLRLSMVASVIGSLIYCFSISLSVVASWPHALFSQAWAILATAAFIRFLYQENWIVWGPIFALFGSLMVLASPSGSLVFFLYIWLAIFLFAFTDKDSHARKLSWFKHATMALIVCLLISAPALLPYVIHSSENIRWISLLDGQVRPFVGGGKIPFEATLFQQSVVPDFINIFWPTDGKENSKGYYVGAIAIFFVVLAVLDFSNWRTRLFKCHLILMGWSLFSIAGSNLGMAYLNYQLPGLNDLREPWFYSYIFSFFSAIVAAYGIQSVISGQLQRYKVLLTAVCLIVVLTVLDRAETRHYLNQIYLIDISILILITAVVCYGKGRNLGWKNLWAIAMVMTLGFAISYEIRQHPLSPPDSIALSASSNNPEIQSVLEVYSRLNRMENIDLYRTISDLKPINLAGSYRGVDSLSGFYSNVRGMRSAGSPHPREIFEEYNYKFNIPGYYQLHGVKYFISDKLSYSQSHDYKELFRIGDIRVYESLVANPEFFIVHHLSGFYKTPQEYWARVSNFGDVSNSIFLKESDKKLVAGIPVRPVAITNATIRIVSNKANSKAVNAELNEQGLLVLNEHFNSSWTVLVDGAQVKPIRVNHNQLGVLLAAGKHVVEYSYMPSEVVILLFGFAGGLLIVITQLIWYTRRMFLANRSSGEHLAGTGAS